MRKQCYAWLFFFPLSLSYNKSGELRKENRVWSKKKKEKKKPEPEPKGQAHQNETQDKTRKNERKTLRENKPLPLPKTRNIVRKKKKVVTESPLF